MSEQNEFEKRWQQVQSEPALIQVEVKNKVEVDLSLDNVLDLYIAHANKGVRENRLQRAVFDELVKRTEGFKSSLTELDKGQNLHKLGFGIGSRLKRLF